MLISPYLEDEDFSRLEAFFSSAEEAPLQLQPLEFFEFSDFADIFSVDFIFFLL
jgi:hypothetical protein